jgi:FAD:protein FMN transferase
MPTPPPANRTLKKFAAMATPCEICLDAPPAVATVALDLALAEVARIEHRYSRYRSDSLVALINSCAGGAAVEVDPEMAGLLNFAQHCWALSDRAFDVTSGVLREVWRPGMTQLPEPQALAATTARIGWQRVQWQPHEQGGQIQLAAGMQIDLGGIGKEYAADRAAAVLASAGVRHGYVNLGGDIAVVGPQADGTPWLVGIADPNGGPLAVAHIDLAAGGLATSGSYERFISIAGRRYGHLLDARSGWPVDGLQSVSVLAPSALVAGALATIAALMGARGVDWLRSQAVRAWIIDASGKHIAL